MNELFKKLQYKGSEQILVLHAPPEFAPQLDIVAGQVRIDQGLTAATRYDFALVFVKSVAEVIENAAPVVQQMNEDAVLWYAYPKKSSKKYQTDLSRDHGWEALGKLGYEGVRMVAIDADWSAFRVRHVDTIKRLTRNATLALSERGKARTE
jgi:hypothetical protein